MHLSSTSLSAGGVDPWPMWGNMWTEWGLNYKMSALVSGGNLVTEIYDGPDLGKNMGTLFLVN